MRSKFLWPAACAAATLVAAAVTPAAPANGSLPPEPYPAAQVQAMQHSLGISAERARTLLAQQDSAATVVAKVKRAMPHSQAGYWFDPASGKLVVAVSSRRDADQARALGATAKVVARSGEQLAGLERAISKFARTGVPGLVGWGVDPQANAVAVRVNKAAATSATQAFLAKVRALSSAIHVQDATPQRQQSGTIHPGDPWWPGSETNCSTGFDATDASGTKHMLTAGHCTNDVNQPAYGASGQQNRLGTSNKDGQHSVNAQEGDFGMVDVDQPGWDITADVNTWGNAVVTVTGSVDPFVGQQICHSGNTTHWQCGKVTAVDQEVNYGNVIVDGLFITDACSNGGDSGGAYVAGDKAVGLHSGGGNPCGQSNPDTDAQPVNEALTKWNLSLTVGGGQPSPVSVTNPGDQTTPVNQPVNLANAAAGGTAPYTWSATGLPAGLSISPSSGTVTGTATTAGSSRVTITATDSASQAGSASFTWTISPPGGGDDEPPTTPGNPRVTGTTDTTATLTWDASVDNVGVTGYDVYNGSALATTVTGTTATLSGLIPDTSYSLTVQAKDAAGNRSKPTVAVTARTQPGSSGRTLTNNTAYPIRDFYSTYSRISSTLTGSAARTVPVVANITHTCAEDLGISLLDPRGQIYALKYAGGNSCTAWNGPQTFTARNVSAPSAGTWTLRVTDYGPGDTGTLTSWSITL